MNASHGLRIVMKVFTPIHNSIEMSKIKYKKIALLSVKITGLIKSWRLPTLPLLRSNIGVTRFNFSVRNGKRWNPRTIITLINSVWQNTSLGSSGEDFSTYYPPSINLYANRLTVTSGRQLSQRYC